MSLAFDERKRSLLTLEIDYTTAARIVETLDYIPLAIVQAGAYISQLMISLDDYLAAFKSKAYREKLPPKTLSRGAHAVWTTWEITFGKIQKKSPAAADLLLLCSFFSYENIPVEMLSSELPSGQLNPFSRLFEEQRC